MIPTVIIGGHDSIVNSKIIPQLANHGLKVIHFVSWDRARVSELPAHTQVVFIMTDMVSHRLNDGMKSEAEGRDIKIVYGTRKATINHQRLTEAGFPLLATTTPIPVDDAPQDMPEAPMNNPRLPFGYYTAFVITGGLDVDRAAIMLMITYSPQPDARGCVYTDTLITRAAYESGGPTDKVVELFKSAGLRPNEMFKIKGHGKYDRADELWGKVVYFRMGPRVMSAETGETLTYMERTQWMLASSRQRKKSNWKEIEPTIHEYPNVIIHTEEVNMSPKTAPVVNTAASLARATQVELPPEPDSPHPFDHEKTFATSLQRDRYRGMLMILAVRPDSTGTAVSERMGWKSGVTFRNIWSTCRSVLGIERNRSDEVILDRSVYEPACKALGVPPVEWTRLRRPRDLTVDRKPVPSIQLSPVPPLSSLVLTAPVADTEKITVKPTDTRELKEIITLLREEMARQDMRRLVITPTVVEFIRVVTVEGKLEI